MGIENNNNNNIIHSLNTLKCCETVKCRSSAFSQCMGNFDMLGYPYGKCCSNEFNTWSGCGAHMCIPHSYIRPLVESQKIIRCRDPDCNLAFWRAFEAWVNCRFYIASLIFVFFSCSIYKIIFLIYPSKTQWFDLILMIIIILGLFYLNDKFVAQYKKKIEIEETLNEEIEEIELNDTK